jgi:hypothetical protein
MSHRLTRSRCWSRRGAVVVALLLWTGTLAVITAGCFQPFPVENLPCPCAAGYICCQLGPTPGGVCVSQATVAQGRCGQRAGLPDGVGMVVGDIIESVDHAGDGAGRPVGGPDAPDMPLPPDPVARPGDVLRFSASEVDTIPAFVACFGASLVHADGTQEPLTTGNGFVEVSNDNGQIVGGGAGCPGAQGIAYVNGLAPGQGTVRFRWQSGDIVLDASVLGRVLPYRFQLTTGQVVVPVNDQAPIPVTVTVLDQSGQPIDWGGPSTAVAPAVVFITIADESIAMERDPGPDRWNIFGVAPGQTTFTLRYYFPYGPEYILAPQDVIVLDDSTVTGLSIRLFDRQPPYSEIAAGQVLLPGGCYEARAFADTMDAAGSHSEALTDATWSTTGSGATLTGMSPAVLCAMPSGHGVASLKVCGRGLCAQSSYPVVDPARLQLAASPPAAPTSATPVNGAPRLCPGVRVSGHYLDNGTTADLTGDPLLVWTSSPPLTRSTDAASGQPELDGAGNPCFDPGSPAPASGTPVTTSVNYVGGPATPARFSWTIGP